MIKDNWIWSMENRAFWMQRSAEYSWLNNALIAKSLIIILDGFARTVGVIQQSGLRHVAREYYMRLAFSAVLVPLKYWRMLRFLKV